MQKVEIKILQYTQVSYNNKMELFTQKGYPEEITIEIINFLSTADIHNLGFCNTKLLKRFKCMKLIAERKFIKYDKNFGNVIKKHSYQKILIHDHYNVTDFNNKNILPCQKLSINYYLDTKIFQNLKLLQCLQLGGIMLNKCTNESMQCLVNLETLIFNKCCTYNDKTLGRVGIPPKINEQEKNYYIPCLPNLKNVEINEMKYGSVKFDLWIERNLENFSSKYSLEEYDTFEYLTGLQSLKLHNEYFCLKSSTSLKSLTIIGGKFWLSGYDYEDKIYVNEYPNLTYLELNDRDLENNFLSTLTNLQILNIVDCRCPIESEPEESPTIPINLKKLRVEFTKSISDTALKYYKWYNIIDFEKLVNLMELTIINPPCKLSDNILIYQNKFPKAQIISNEKQCLLF